MCSSDLRVSQSFLKSADTFPAFDMHCPMSSLPLAFATRLDTIPADIPYLPAPAPNRVQAWEDRLGPRTRLRVGLVWSGNPNHSNDHNRSVTLQTLSRLFDVDATFVSLQKDAKPADQTVLAQTDIVDLTSELSDFNETAALIACLDLVITVDTSVAHLAGALGCPTWILLPYTPDYRWLLDRDDSPWYPTVRLFRQTAARDYAQVLDRVRTELAQLCAQRNPDAQISSRQAPDLRRDNADSLHRKGLQFLRAGQYDHALRVGIPILGIDGSARRQVCAIGSNGDAAAIPEHQRNGHLNALAGFQAEVVVSILLVADVATVFLVDRIVGIIQTLVSVRFRLESRVGNPHDRIDRVLGVVRDPQALHGDESLVRVLTIGHKLVG